MEDLISIGISAEQAQAEAYGCSAIDDDSNSQVGASLMNSHESILASDFATNDNLIDISDGTKPGRAHGQLTYDTAQQPRQKLEPPPAPILEQWVAERIKARPGKSVAASQRGRACLILSRDGELVEGVIEAVHHEMVLFAKGRDDFLFEIQGPATRPFLYMEGPSQDLVAKCVDEARTCADDIINDRSIHLDLVYVEPPPASVHDSVVMLVDNRPQLVSQPINSSADNGAMADKTNFDKVFLQQLTAALRKAGRIKDKVNLRVHLGRFHLTSFPRSQNIETEDDPRFNLEQISKIVRHGRARSEFVTQIGNLEEALRVLRSIKNNDQIFLSEDMATTTVQVRPDFYFDGESSKWRFEAHLGRTGGIRPVNDHKNNPFSVTSVRAVEMINKVKDTQLDFKTLSLGQMYDWNIETIPDVLIKKVGFPTIESEIKAASILFPNIENARDEDYPRMRFYKHNGKVHELRRVAIRSVFRFRYNPAPYQIEFTIRREWSNVMAMANDKIEPATTFGITVYGENWGETRASEVAKTRQGWGQELEHLFRDAPDSLQADGMDSRIKGEARVQSLVNIVHDIRRALTIEI